MVKKAKFGNNGAQETNLGSYDYDDDGGLVDIPKIFLTQIFYLKETHLTKFSIRYYAVWHITSVFVFALTQGSQYRLIDYCITITNVLAV